MSHRILRALTAALLFGLTVLAPLSMPSIAEAAPTQADGPKVGKVDVTVHVIQATESNKKVDQRLSSLLRYLKPLRYTGYELLATHNVPVSGRSSASFNIAGDRKVTIELLDRDEKKARLRVQFMGAKGKKLLDTTVLVPRNGTFVVAGPRYGDGVLVLPVTARY